MSSAVSVTVHIPRSMAFLFRRWAAVGASVQPLWTLPQVRLAVSAQDDVHDDGPVVADAEVERAGGAGRLDLAVDQDVVDLDAWAAHRIGGHVHQLPPARDAGGVAP